MILPGFALPVFALLLAPAPPPRAAAPQRSFVQIAKEAEQARAAERMQDAILLYGEGVRLRPSWSDGWWSLGTLLYDQDRFPEAQAALARFVSIAPKPGPAFALLALCEYETRSYENSAAHFRDWAASGSQGTTELIAVANFHQALLLTRSGRFEQALRLLGGEAGGGDSSPALVEALGLASLRIRSLPEDYAPAQRERVWLAGKAALQAAAGRLPQALRDAKRLLPHYGQQPNVHYFLGSLLLEGKDSDAAAREFEQELRISPRHAPAMLQLAVRELDRREPAKALPLAERAVALEPDCAAAHSVFGQALFAVKRFGESVRELEAARRLAPGDADIRMALSKAYAALGRARDAEREREGNTK
jgi:tetratricopeptide (TPR) repeat protein